MFTAHPVNTHNTPKKGCLRHSHARLQDQTPVTPGPKRILSSGSKILQENRICLQLPHPARTTSCFASILFLCQATISQAPAPALASPPSHLPPRCSDAATLGQLPTNLMMRVNGEVRAKGGTEMHGLRALLWPCLPSPSFLKMDIPFIW